MSLYETLGVARDATPDAIKKAYRKLAMVHHPDRGGDKATLQEVQQAYDVLSDPGRRERYDTTGATNLAPSREDMARQTLAQLINEVLDLLDKGNSDDLAYISPLAATHDQLYANRRQNAAAIEKLERRVTQRQEALRRLRRKAAKGSDVLADALNGAIVHLRQEVAKVHSLQTLIGDILTLLEDYDYEVAQRPQKASAGTQDFYADLESMFGARFSPGRAWPEA